MVGIVGDPALQALHGPQNFPKSHYSARILVWAMENETLKSWGVAPGLALSSATTGGRGCRTPGRGAAGGRRPEVA